MKIGIDSRVISSEVTGAGRVLELLLSQLKNYPAHQFVVFHTSAYLPPNEKPANMEFVLLDIPPSAIRNFFIAGWKIQKYRLDVLYYGFVDTPFFLNAPTIAVVYDLYYMYDRNYFAKSGRIRHALTKLMTWWRLKAATSLIAISNTTSEQIRRLPFMENKKIFKIDLCLYKQEFNSLPSLPDDIKPNNYILYVGNNRRHKNLKLIIEAFAKISIKVPNYKLVMCGAIDLRYDDPISMIKTLNKEKEIIHLRHVTDVLLERLYADCAYVVVPSFYEGFGLPALEAASRGKAVLCSTASALREVLSDAGIYKDPSDVDGWSDAMLMLATDVQKRDEIATSCYARSKQYSAERFGRETINALVETGKRC